MIFPDLEYTSRDTEFKLYTNFQRAQVIFGYMFEGHSHRKLDELYLMKDGNKSRGWQSMGILHYLGITGKHKKIFNGYSLDEAITILQNYEKNKTELIISHISLLDNSNNISLNSILEQFEIELNNSSKDTSKNRKARLEKSNKKPLPIEVKTFVFKRNPDVVAEVLCRANGICENCKKIAPFRKKTDNSFYLEVHHCIPLSQGGDDSIENAIALCPNCHRKMHFG